MRFIEQDYIRNRTANKFRLQKSPSTRKKQLAESMVDFLKKGGCVTKLRHDEFGAILPKANLWERTR